MKKIFWYGMFLLTGLGIGILLTWQLHSPKSLSTKQTTVLLESINNILELAVVEGSFLESTEYSDPNIPYSILDPWNQQLTSLLPREAHIRVRGTVKVGYRIDSFQTKINANSKTVMLLDFNQPEILSVDHHIEKLNKTEYIFHPFTEEDDLKIYNHAKESIKQAAEKSSLFNQADKQKKELFEALENMLNTMGWQLVISPHPTASTSSNVDMIPDNPTNTPIPNAGTTELRLMSKDSVSEKKTIEKDYDTDIQAIQESLENPK